MDKDNHCEKKEKRNELVYEEIVQNLEKRVKQQLFTLWLALQLTNKQLPRLLFLMLFYQQQF